MSWCSGQGKEGPAAPPPHIQSKQHHVQALHALQNHVHSPSDHSVRGGYYRSLVNPHKPLQRQRRALCIIHPIIQTLVPLSPGHSPHRRFLQPDLGRCLSRQQRAQETSVAPWRATLKRWDDDAPWWVGVSFRRALPRREPGRHCCDCLAGSGRMGAPTGPCAAPHKEQGAMRQRGWGGGSTMRSSSVVTTIGRNRSLWQLQRRKERLRVCWSRWQAAAAHAAPHAACWTT